MTARKSAPAVADDNGRLNFLVVITDDQGRWAMPNRMPELHMPNLQALIDDGLEMEQAYCASPVCSPARASLLTGRMPSAHGVHDWLVGGRHPDARPDLYLDGQPTTPEVLADAGYECMLSGKWHVGDSRWPAPGFSSWFAHRYGGGPYFDAPVWANGKPAAQSGYLTEAITDHAVAFLRNRDTHRPFYLQVGYTAPHTPWLDNHPGRYLDRYRDCDFDSVPREPRHPWAIRDDFDAAFAEPVPHLAGYCAALSGVDAGLGQLRDELDRQGLLDSTAIVYMSDNGFSCGHHGIWGKGNGTYPLNFWDNSVRVPTVARLPGGARGSTQALVTAAAWHATLCDLAQVRPPEDRWGITQSFANLLRVGTPGSAEYTVVLAEYGQGRMITDGRWKLVVRSTTGPCELYDTHTDPGEANNLYTAPSTAGTRADLESALRDWFATHQRADTDAFDAPVSGYGQVHPVTRGRNRHDTYMPFGTDSSTFGGTRGA